MVDRGAAEPILGRCVGIQRQQRETVAECIMYGAAERKSAGREMMPRHGLELVVANGAARCRWIAKNDGRTEIMWLETVDLIEQPPPGGPGR